MSFKQLILGLFLAVTCVMFSVADNKSEDSSGDSKKSDRWPVFRGNALGTAVADDTFAGNLREAWTFKVPEGAFDTTPVIEDGVVYIGDLDGKFYALDLATGKPKWQYAIKDNGFPSSAAVKDGQVFVGDYDGALYCLDAKTGAVMWKFATDAEVSCPNFHKNAVIVASQDSRLYSLDAKTGKLNWKYAIEDQIQSSPTIVEGRAFLAGCDAKLHIIDVDQGKPIATVDIGNPTGVTPAVVKDHVFFGTEGGDFFCVDWRKAKTVWSYADPKTNQSIRSCPTANESIVIYGSRSKQLYALNPQNGRVLWQVPSRRGIDSSPVIAGKRVFIGTGDGKVLGIDWKTGKIAWQHQARGGFGGSPAIAQGSLVIASDEGVVYCFQVDNTLAENSPKRIKSVNR